MCLTIMHGFFLTQPLPTENMSNSFEIPVTNCTPGLSNWTKFPYYPSVSFPKMGIIHLFIVLPRLVQVYPVANSVEYEQ